MLLRVVLWDVFLNPKQPSWLFFVDVPWLTAMGGVRLLSTAHSLGLLGWGLGSISPLRVRVHLLILGHRALCHWLGPSGSYDSAPFPGLVPLG